MGCCVVSYTISTVNKCVEHFPMDLAHILGRDVLQPSSPHQRWFCLNTLEEALCSLTENIPLQHCWLQPEACWHILAFFPGLMCQQELGAPMGDGFTPAVPTGPQQPWGEGRVCRVGLSGCPARVHHSHPSQAASLDSNEALGR